jgi:serine/threonine-protein kinase
MPPEFPGAYAIEGVLGTGGMAMVYRARDLRRPRTVAIKILRAEFVNAVGAERFTREIALTSGLSHPHIVPLLDSGETIDADGQTIPYYVMPLVEGESLRERLLRDARLPVADAIRFAREILDAVGYAHRHGVIHRDIKPANILLSGGHAVVADFGIARPVAGTGSAAAQGDSLTQSGLVIGTLPYMSPEQALGQRNLDARTDLYAIGCVLYEMLTGVTPFTGRDPQAIIAQKVSGAFVAATAMRPALPRGLDPAIAHALEPEPSDRFGKAEEFAEALSRVDMRPSPAVGRESGGRFRRGAAIVAGITLIAAGGGAIARWGGRRPVPPAAVRQARIAVLPFEVASRDTTLTLVAGAFTSDIIDALAEFPALSVISKNGVLPFRGSNASPDSVGRALNVANLVTGDLRPNGDSLTVQVRLVDARSGVQLARIEILSSTADMLRLRSRVIDSITSSLRTTIGDQLDARERNDATNEEAWELHAQVEGMQEHELTFTGAMTPSKRARFDIADSLAARAARLDPHWAAPVIERGKLALMRATAERGAAFNAGMAIAPDSITPAALRQDALRFAAEALRRSPGDPDALYLRGKARAELWAASAAGPDSLRLAAEADFRAAVNRRRDMADAWNDLSVLLLATGDYSGAFEAANNALKADAFLRSAPVVMSRLLFTSLASGRTDDARAWCETGKSRHPRDPRFWGCDLTILGWTGTRRADVATAWRNLAAAEARDSSNLLATGWGTRRLLVAAIAARAGMRDSALAIVRLVRSATPPRGAASAQADYGEAYVQTLLGNRDKAVPLLERYLAENPALRRQVAKSPWFTPLHGDQRFIALTSR